MRISRSSNQSPSIKFVCDPELIDAIAAPYPAAKNIPKWFKKLHAEIPPPSPGDFPGETIKNCMPVLDAFSAGFIIPLAAPIRMIVEGKGQITGTWREHGVTLLESHSEQQLGTESGFTGPFLKWVNYWGMELPPGYSALFMPPVNQSEDTLFECFSGVVDCDKYTNPVNFPFRWTGPDHYDGIIPAGTPLVQVIPFKRENWVMNASAATDEQVKIKSRIRASVQSAPHGYRDKYRSPKLWRTSQNGD